MYWSIYLCLYCIPYSWKFECILHSGQSDLNNRFVTTINTAVDSVMHGIEPFTSAHAHYFTSNDIIALPTSISLSGSVSIAEMDATFTKFLISYFHKVWYGGAAHKVSGVAKVSTIILFTDQT